MANNPELVSVGKPKTSGAVFRAPTGTALPTDASSNLAATYVCLGYVSEDGVEHDSSIDTNTINAWGGDPVIVTQNGATDDFSWAMIESLNTEVLKTFYGDGNVSGTLATGITITANNNDLGEHVYVIDQILRNGTLQRIVIPRGKVTSREAITYKDDEVISYGITVTGLQDSSGNTSYTYVREATASGGGEG